MKKQIKNASDNQQANISNNFDVSDFAVTITSEIQRFVGSEEPDKHEELRIHVPIGFMRNENIEDMKTSRIFFDLLLSKKRLRFNIELAEESVAAGDVKIVKDYHDNIERLTYYKIGETLALNLADVRGIIRNIGEYFKPLYFDVFTVEEGTDLTQL